MADDNEQVHVTKTDARAGSSNPMNRYVLAISLVLVIVVFAVILLYGVL